MREDQEGEITIRNVLGDLVVQDVKGHEAGELTELV
jgi:hypothetical protein